MHPNCRHEFIPVWLETMSDAELAEAIEKSKISPKADTRSEEERNAYAAWQVKQRQIYHERLYFEQAKQRLGKAMPYESIAAFRRSYRTAEDTFAHKRSHNLIKDFKEHNELKAVLQGDNLPKTLAEFQDLKYNKKQEYELLNRENITISKIKAKNWSPIFIQKALETYYDFREKNIELTDHGVARLLQRGFDKDTIIDICKNYPFNYIQEDGKRIKFYSGITVIYANSSDEIVSIVSRNVPKGEWKNV